MQSKSRLDRELLATESNIQRIVGAIDSEVKSCANTPSSGASNMGSNHPNQANLVPPRPTKYVDINEDVYGLMSYLDTKKINADTQHLLLENGLPGGSTSSPSF